MYVKHGIQLSTIAGRDVKRVDARGEAFLGSSFTTKRTYIKTFWDRVASCSTLQTTRARAREVNANETATTLLVSQLHPHGLLTAAP